MWCRRRIDIGWSDLAAALTWSLWRGPREPATRDAESVLFDGNRTIATLSARSGLELLLETVDWPAGSEILMSAVTIPDMPRIITAHGLVPVSVPVELKTMFPTRDQLRARITPRTRAILVAHLFGAIHDPGPIAELAAEHDLLFIEDGAQAFDGRGWQGHRQSDVVLFSFGPIKTATALGGGLLLVRNADLRARMRRTLSAWPVQRHRGFLRRVLRFSLLKLVSLRIPFGLLMRLLLLSGRDPDAVLNEAVRGFPGGHLRDRLRYQPCTALLKLMARRQRRFDPERQQRRTLAGAELLRALESRSPEYAGGNPGSIIPGATAPRHTWWVFPLPVTAERKHAVLKNLRRQGFDASGGSQLMVLPTKTALAFDGQECDAAELDRIIFPPLDPDMPDEERHRLRVLLGELQAER